MSTNNAPLDGLALLGQQRQKATRTTKGAVAPAPAPSARRTLQPRHPAPQKPAQAAPVEPPLNETVPPAPRTAAASTAATGPQATDNKEIAEPLIRSTLYLDTELDSWLQRVADLGRSATPRIDISRSAVVRYALQQLQASMGTDDVFTELASRAIESTSKGGRKRI